MRSYEMTEIVHRGRTECLTEAFGIATDDRDGVSFPSTSTCATPRTHPAPEPPNRAG